jgi:Acetyltransferase (GNAT) domain
LIYKIDPLQDPRWPRFVETHPFSSVFHTRGWLQAIHRTYGYKPAVYTLSPPTTELKNGLVFCRVRSWLTGARRVSLPFSDHCEPLCESPDELDFLVRCLQAEMEHQEWKYLEVRPARWEFPAKQGEPYLRPFRTYVRHRINLAMDPDQLFLRLDPKIKQSLGDAGQSDLTFECGRSDIVLRKFYDLMVRARQDRRLPTQPLQWFRNLVDCMGDALEIRVASRANIPVASTVSLRFRDTTVGKYMCSDAGDYNLSATPYLIWADLGAAKANGATEYDWGRSETEDEGLVGFKDDWGCIREDLVYWRYPALQSALMVQSHSRFSKYFFGLLPQNLLKAAGRVLYRHIG